MSATRKIRRGFVRIPRIGLHRIGSRPGYGTYVSLAEIREWSRLPVKARLDWIEEMIEIERRLPRRIRERHERLRRADA